MVLRLKSLATTTSPPFHDVNMSPVCAARMNTYRPCIVRSLPLVGHRCLFVLASRSRGLRWQGNENLRPQFIRRAVPG